MPLVLSEDETIIKNTARDFAGRRLPVKALRALRDSRDAEGFDRAAWREMAGLGWAGMLIPERYGGTGFGFRGLGLVLEELGRTLAASPLLSTVVLAGSAIDLAGSEAQRSALLPRIAAGDLVLAFAHDEEAAHRPFAVATRAERRGAGFVLNGQKRFVLDGHVADQLVVVARTSGPPGGREGLSLFLVDANAPGLVRTRTIMVDSRNAANLSLENVAVAETALIGPAGHAGDVIEEVLDCARILLAAEMLGSIEALFETTIDYLKTRTQFGVPIGSFQALKHRAAQMFAEIELSKSVVLDALSALDERRNDVAAIASLAKARLSDTFMLVSNEAVQMHGGMGMTDELDIGLYLKRARVAQACFGDAAFHRDRYAALEGF